MVVIKISDEYTISIPIPYRQMFPAGQEVAVIADPRGRLIIMPIEQIRAVLMETFGMWADRADLPDSITHMDEMRRGHRLNDIGLRSDEAN